MSKRKAKKNIITEEPSQGKPFRTKGWEFHQHGLTLLISLFLIIITFAAFEQVRTCAFINLDDNVYITDNQPIQDGLTLEGVSWTFRTIHAGHWHPLTWLSHMLDCQLYGLSPSGHHLTNLAFHIVNTLLLFLVLKRMTGALWRSCFVAALFAVHPLRVESVAWVAERKDVLSAFFWMLTMWAYIRYVERPGLNRYLLALLSFALGLLSKPMLVTLPFVLLLLDYWPLGRFQLTPSGMNPKSPGSKPKNASDQISMALRLIREKALFFVLSGASILLTVFAVQEGGGVRSWEIYTLQTRAANALVSYVSYIAKMIWPRHLAIFYPFPETFPLWKVAGAVLLLSFLTFLAIRAARKYPYLVVGWFWYIGTLVPVIGIVQAGMQAMADRFTYVPMIGLFIMITWSVTEPLAGWRYRRVVLPISAGILLLILMMVTRLQVQYWQNSIMLFEHSIDVTSNNSLAHNNLGVALVEQGKIREAVAHYAEALRIQPGSAMAHNNLGSALMRQGKIQEAVAHCTEALRIQPDSVEAHNNLGSALMRQGKIQEAIANFTEALRISPDHPGVHYNLGVVLQGQGKIEEAILHFAEAVRIRPDYAIVHNNLGAALWGQGKVQDAIAHFTKAVQAKPDYADAHINLGFGYLTIGDKVSALEEYKILKKLNPDLANKLYQEILK
jgi:tetratricopeptide (TPR) repeat protein